MRNWLAEHRQNKQHVAEVWKLFERATPKVKYQSNDVRVLYAREILTRFLSEAKLLKRMVARDGIEPPTRLFRAAYRIAEVV
jgi:hypothetical protein